MTDNEKKSTIDRIEYNSFGWQHLGAELVFTQDRFGDYHSFFWQPTSIKINQSLANQSFNKSLLTPLLEDDYRQKITKVLEYGIPEKYNCIFKHNSQSLLFELIISPILSAQGDCKLVLVMGRFLNEIKTSTNAYANLLTSQELSQQLLTKSKIYLNQNPYHKLLTNITTNIRHTLNLETIWQQTVNVLGSALEVSRCLILIPESDQNYLDVQAEYCQSSSQSLLGISFNLDEESCLKQVMLSNSAIQLEKNDENEFGIKSILAIATFYQKQCNGIICLQQCDRHRVWNQAEIELMEALADHLGTAMGHANLYRKLEQANLEAKEASRLKSEFLASTSHELRTPLNGIIGFLKLILDGMTDNKEEEREFIEEAYNSALYLLNLIEDILDIAKIEAGKLEFKFDQIVLAQICEDVYKFAHNQAVRKNLDFEINMPQTYDQIVLHADYQRLLQVMLNLVGNSLKFTPKGKISITAEVVSRKSIRDQMNFPGMLKISVKDTGIGVALDKQDKLFENFFQADGAFTKAYPGTGLGLAISKRLVEGMGGKISFFSLGEGLGSTVTFSVPLSQLPVLKKNNFND